MLCSNTLSGSALSALKLLAVVQGLYADKALLLVFGIGCKAFALYILPLTLEELLPWQEV